MTHTLPKPLEVFSQAIAYTGWLTWWSSDDDIIQIELMGGQLRLPEEEPNSPVALRFSGSVAASFLTRAEPGSEFPSVGPDWSARLQNDEIGPMRITPGEFQLGERLDPTPWLKDAAFCETRMGPEPSWSNLLGIKYRMGLWAGSAGVFISAQRVKLLTHRGEIEWDEVPRLHQEWWTYWQQYWARRGGSDAFPRDYTCEATEPAD